MKVAAWFAHEEDLRGASYSLSRTWQDVGGKSWNNDSIRLYAEDIYVAIEILKRLAEKLAKRATKDEEAMNHEQIETETQEQEPESKPTRKKK